MEGEEKGYELSSAIFNGYWGDWNNDNFEYTSWQLKKWLSNPQVYNKQLRQACWYAYASNGTVRKTTDYIVALPTLDSVCFTRNRTPEGEMPKSYEKDKKLFLDILNRLKHKEIIRDSILKNCNDGVSFYYLAMNEKAPKGKYLDPFTLGYWTDLSESTEQNALTTNFSLFALPVDHCKIISIKNGAYEIAFDLWYFTQFLSKGLSRKLMTYPKEIRDAWKKYNSVTETNRWFILDNTRTVVTKVGAKRDQRWGLPFSTAALEDIAYLNYFTDTKRNTLDSVNSRIIYQVFPQGLKPGTNGLTDAGQEMQHNRVKEGLNSRKRQRFGQAFFSLAPGTEIKTIDVKTDIFDDNKESGIIDRIAGDVGFAAPLLNGVTKGNYATASLNLELVSAMVRSWVAQFSTELCKVVNANFIKHKNCYVEISYLPTTHANRQFMVGYMKDLYTSGKGSLTAWVASTGMDPVAYLALLDDEKAQDIENKYPVHKTSFTMTSRYASEAEVEDISGGRPPEDNPTNENTVQSQANNANSNPSPSG